MATFYDRFIQCAERWPQNVAVEVQRPDGQESYTYAELRRMAESVAGWLAGEGLQPGARVAILADNHPRWVAAYLGIIAAGGTAVPLDTAYHADQVAKLLRDSGSVLLICDEKHEQVAREAAQGTEVGIVQTGSSARNDSPRLEQKASELRPEGRVGAPVPTQAGEIETDFDSIFAQYQVSFTPVSREPEDVASLLYTSGTTADPKGVMLTHANLLGEADAVFAWAHIGPEDAILGVLPLFHVLSQMANLLLPLVAGTRVVYLSTLNTTELLRALRERKITAFAVVPQFFNLIHERIFKEVQQRGFLAKFAFRRLMRLNVFCRGRGLNPGRIFFRRIHGLFGDRMRYLVTGGSRFDPQIGNDFYALGIDVLQAYGLTETCGGAFANSREENVIGSVGKPLKGIEGKIIDAQASDDGSPASGEILTRGPIVMKGYWNRPDATADVLKEGWLYTGDLGYLDERGNLFITGRKKDVIILANGKNVYPEEIEVHYLQSPFVKEMCVMGIEDGGQEKLYAVIVPNFEVLRQRKVLNAKEVIRFDVEGLSAKLPSTKRIAGYEIWREDLPRTTTRKLKRFEIEKKVRTGKRDGSSGELTVSKPLSDEENAWLQQPEVQRAIKVIREYAIGNPEQIRPSDNLELDLGLDSMRRVELLVAVEQALGGDVEESRLADVYTVRELVDAVRESAKSDKSVRPTQAFAGWGVVLREDPTDPEAIAAGKSRPLTDTILYILTRIAKLIWRMRAPVRYEGLENLPKAPYLLCSNHQSFIDPLILLMVLPWKVLLHLFAVGTSEIFGSGFMRWVARILRVVVVDPDANLIPAMRAGAYGLRHGMSLILYPEGERSIDGTPKTFKKGAAILSIHMQVPIVPIAIDGVFDAWPRGKPFQRFAPLKIKFGKPIMPPPESTASEEAYAKLTAELKARVVEMWEGLKDGKR
ncbi:MAG TPA: AMP-binding protein [Terriglobales bacterium]|nr:AMP-binding protein [Terriglobales bacterium]